MRSRQRTSFLVNRFTIWLSTMKFELLDWMPMVPAYGLRLFNKNIAWHLFDVTDRIILKFPTVLNFPMMICLALKKHLNPSIIRSWNRQLSNVLIICRSPTKHFSFEKMENRFDLLSDEDLWLSDNAEIRQTHKKVRITEL